MSVLYCFKWHCHNSYFQNIWDCVNLCLWYVCKVSLYNYVPCEKKHNIYQFVNILFIVFHKRYLSLLLAILTILHIHW